MIRTLPDCRISKLTTPNRCIDGNHTASCSPAQLDRTPLLGSNRKSSEAATVPRTKSSATEATSTISAPPRRNQKKRPPTHTQKKTNGENSERRTLVRTRTSHGIAAPGEERLCEQSLGRAPCLPAAISRLQIQRGGRHPYTRRDGVCYSLLFFSEINFANFVALKGTAFI